MRICYFFEDRAHDGFVRALVKRVAIEESIPVDSLSHDVRSCRGGSRVIRDFISFLKDTEAGASYIDLLIVVKDGNCKGYSEQVRNLKKYLNATHPLREKVVYAVPDPHIERWYIGDQGAFRDGVGLNAAPNLPQYKCKKDYYKEIMSRALRGSGVSSLLGGVEYAERIVDRINLDLLGRRNAGFQNFVGDLRRMFKRV